MLNYQEIRSSHQQGPDPCWQDRACLWPIRSLLQTGLAVCRGMQSVGVAGSLGVLCRFVVGYSQLVMLAALECCVGLLWDAVSWCCWQPWSVVSVCCGMQSIGDVGSLGVLCRSVVGCSQLVMLAALECCVGLP